jgi:hypothetical protein
MIAIQVNNHDTDDVLVLGTEPHRTGTVKDGPIYVYAGIKVPATYATHPEPPNYFPAVFYDPAERPNNLNLVSFPQHEWDELTAHDHPTVVRHLVSLGLTENASKQIADAVHGKANTYYDTDCQRHTLAITGNIV